MKKYYPLLDLGKFICALLIVALHSPRSTNIIIRSVIIDTFAYYAVPFFFATSSFLYFSRIQTRQNLWKYIKRLGLLYIIWLIINLPIIFYCDYWIEDRNFTNFCYIFFNKIILGISYHGSWYISASIKSVLIIYILSKWVNNFWLFIISLSMFLLFTTTHYYSVFFPVSYLNIMMPIIDVFSPIGTSTYLAVIFVILGKIIAENNLVLNKIPCYILSFSLLFFIILGFIEIFTMKYINGETYTGYYMSIYIIIPLLIIYLKKQDVKQAIIYKVLRRQSTFIFFVHFILLFFYGGAKNHNILDLSPHIVYFLIVFISMLLCELTYTLSKKYIYLKYLF